MFIEKLEPIDLGEPIYGRTIVGCAPKGATTSRLCLPFYRHLDISPLRGLSDGLPKRAGVCPSCTQLLTAFRISIRSGSSADGPSSRYRGQAYFILMR